MILKSILTSMVWTKKRKVSSLNISVYLHRIFLSKLI